MHDSHSRPKLDAFVRAMATAGKSLRLYPATSPIPRQSIEAASDALASALLDEPAIVLEIARDGLSSSGLPVAASTSGAAELAEQLRSHGVASLAFNGDSSADELLTLLVTIAREPDDLRDAGGIEQSLSAEGVTSIGVTSVHLSVSDTPVPDAEEDLAEFLRGLAADPDRLSAWIAAASAGDHAAFEDGLAELAAAVGEAGTEDLASALAAAFEQQESEGKDALLRAAMSDGASKDVASGMLGHLETESISSSLTAGAFGDNMLVLSKALTELPLAERIASIRQRVQEMLPAAGKTPMESEFLEHMLEVRARTEPEQPLAKADGTYVTVVAAMRVPAAEVDRALAAVDSASATAPRTAVSMMLSLLDSQDDFEQYCSSLDNLARLVPRLIASNDLVTASHVVGQLARLGSRTAQPWPGLGERLEAAIAAATGPETTRGLLSLVAKDPETAVEAHRIIEHGGDAAATSLLEAAIKDCPAGLDAAVRILGRRVADLLPPIAGHTSQACIAPVAMLLSQSDNPRAAAALQALVSRPDEQSRRDALQALAETGSEAVVPALSAALSDPTPAVAATAARGLARVGGVSAVMAISAHLAAADIDGADFPVARELIGALARMKAPEATAVLERLARRKSLIKKRHFGEIQELVRQALIARAGGR